jgi:signal-transduction protein with cAMP-binding, CBS, and nucleotidyltransferase domain
MSKALSYVEYYICCMVEFTSLIKQYIQLSPEAEAEITRVSKVEVFPKGYLIIDEGVTCKRLYFLMKGTVRSYFYQKGKDVTYWIYPENYLFTSWPSYLMKKTSSEFIETIDACTVLSISYDTWQDLYTKFPELDRFGRLIMEEQIALIHEFYMGYYFLSAKEKYELVVSVFPDITQRANLGHIASMLGISQETLSRIRGK